MAGERKKKMSDEDRAFYQGFAVAVACLAREHGQPSTAADIMRGSNITLETLKQAKVDAYDFREIRKAMVK